MELHPGGGQYDCIGLCLNSEQFPRKCLCQFNQPAQHLHVFGYYSKPALRLEDLGWPDYNNYVEAFLSAHDPKQVVDQVEQVLGLPPLKGKQLPPTTPEVLSFRLISALTERYMLARECVDVRCGWYDSSGMEGCYVRKELSFFPEIQRQIDNAQVDMKARVAMGYWLLIAELPDHDRKLRAVIDLQGKAYFLDRPDQHWSFWEEYKTNNRQLLPLVNRLEEQMWK
jgi:uncharacterized short protein YbdD (DUF466 family)